MGKKGGRFANLETHSAGMNSRRTGVALRDASYYMKDGLAKELAGEHEKALNAYSAALGEDPLHLEAWAGQLWMLLYMNEPAEAVLWANKALDAFPNDPDVLSLKALALWRVGSKDSAGELNDAALGMTRDSPNVWLARGEMQAAGDAKSAQTCFTHAIRVGSDAGLVHLRAADILYRLGKHADAVAYFREATRLLPSAAWAWYGYGKAQRKLGRDDIARSAFDKAYRLAPRNPRFARKARNGEDGDSGFFRAVSRFFRRLRR